jgi:hypothetical protein
MLVRVTKSKLRELGIKILLEENRQKIIFIFQSRSHKTKEWIKLNGVDFLILLLDF